MNGRHYRVVVSNAGGKTTSRAAAFKMDSTRAYPYPVKTLVNLQAWRVKVGITDKNVNDVVAAASEFNPAPESGNRYISTGVSATYIGSGSERPRYNLATKFVGGNGRTYTPTYLEYPYNVYDVDELYYGGRAYFNIAVEVPIGAFSGGVWIIDDTTTSTERAAYFKRK